MQYIVSVKLDYQLDVEVEANSFEEAKRKAEMDAMDCDLNSTYGTAEIVELIAIYAEDETGEFIDY